MIEQERMISIKFYRFVIIKYWYGNQTEDYYHWIDLLGLNEPTNRNWAGEDKVIYIFLIQNIYMFLYSMRH